MDYFIECAQGWWLYGMVPLLISVALAVPRVRKNITYRYPLGSYLRAKKGACNTRRTRFSYVVRCILLCLLALVSARPQIVDSQSQTTVEGIDIVLALDFSESMTYCDTDGSDADNGMRRIDIAKQEAIRFIQARTNDAFINSAGDAIGLVVFGGDAITRCPLTQDTKLLKNTIEESHIGIVDYSNTHLATALITAANRLKQSQAKSKIIILLTDGQPSDGDMNPDTAIEVARALNIKVYTIGIGHDEPWEVTHPLFGRIMMPATIDSTLLKKIADDTGGRFFLAHKAHDMKKAYETIDHLEKSQRTTPIFNNKYELGLVGIVLALALVCCEILVSTFMWFGL